MDRKAQLRTLYGFDFPDELFVVWDWFQTLEGKAREAFEVLGITLHGPFDVLAGKFDEPSRYPVTLHWRYQYDLPELFTVMTGNTDGLHWGYWFDDPGRLPPVVASFYARDGVELVEAASLIDALATHLAWTRNGIEENRIADRKHAASYARQAAALDALEAVMPPAPPDPGRTAAAKTPDGMGIVVEPALIGRWIEPAAIDRAEVLAVVESEIAAGRPGTALLIGRNLWDGEKLLALDVFARAYEALDRPALRAVALAHRKHPAIPSLDITKYRAGDFTDLADAFAHPRDVRTLSLRIAPNPDGDWSALTELHDLDLAAARMAKLPASIAACAKLVKVHVYNNELVDLAPVFALPAVTSINAGRNKVVSLDGIERCTTLEHLDLAHNPIRELPAAITKHPSLAELSLFHCPIAKLPDDLAGWRLKKIWVEHSFLPATEHARLRAAVPEIEIIGAPSAAVNTELKPYSPKTKFALHDSIAHPTFGVGVVRVVTGDGRIDVEFPTVGKKTLAHGRS